MSLKTKFRLPSYLLRISLSGTDKSIQPSLSRALETLSHHFPTPNTLIYTNLANKNVFGICYPVIEEETMPPPYHFIIADDEADMLYLLTQVVMRSHPTATITTVDNGQDALTAFEQTGADMLIVDYVMPEMDGVALVRILRSRNITTPIIVLSNTGKVKQLAIAAGATLFLEKSLALRQLPQELAKLLG